MTTKKVEDGNRSGVGRYYRLGVTEAGERCALYLSDEDEKQQRILDRCLQEEDLFTKSDGSPDDDAWENYLWEQGVRDARRPYPRNPVRLGFNVKAVAERAQVPPHSVYDALSRNSTRQVSRERRERIDDALREMNLENPRNAQHPAEAGLPARHGEHREDQEQLTGLTGLTG